MLHAGAASIATCTTANASFVISTTLYKASALLASIKVGTPLGVVPSSGTVPFRPIKAVEFVSPMIKFVANIFRALSKIVGISTPPPGHDERRFVLLWIGIIGTVVVVSAFLFYVIVRMAVVT